MRWLRFHLHNGQDQHLAQELKVICRLATCVKFLIELFLV